MRINTNSAALNTYSRLTQANSAKSSSLAKLSSGLRINKAGDDAAGLSISEKMKGQIGGLKQATRNAQDGISLIQTAEGALNETHSILGRMRDLAAQGANSTLTEEDRGALNKEFTALKEEITRISETTEFNKKNLLDTEGQEFTFQIGANTGEAQVMKVTIGNMGAGALKISGISLSATEADSIVEKTSLDKELTTAKADLTTTKDDLADLEEVNKLAGTARGDAKTAYETAKKNEAHAEKLKEAATYADGKTATDKLTESDIVRLGLGTTVNGSALVAGTTEWGTVTTAIIDEAEAINPSSTGITTLAGVKADKLGNDLKVETKNALDNYDATNKDVATVSTQMKEAQTKVDDLNKLITNLETKIDSGVGLVDSLERTLSTKAIDAIDNAIATVSAQRSDLGAAQNRLTHTINNLTTTQENLTEANSRIRDVDMAQEMMDFTKSNILSQASTSMLAQANAMPQSVLSLLQG